MKIVVLEDVRATLYVWQRLQEQDETRADR